MAPPANPTYLPYFDPTKKNYLDYYNQMTGYGQPTQPPAQNSFPAETSQSAPPAPPPPSTAQQGAQLGTQAYAGYQAGNQISNMLLPSAEASTPVAEAMPAATEAASSGYPATEALLQGGSQEGIAQGMSMAAPDAGGIANTGWGASAMPYAAPAAVAAIGAYTADKGYNAWKDAQGKGVWGGLKQGIKDAGPLNFVPVLGQAAWLGGLAGGAFGGKKGADQQRRDQVRGAAQDSKWFDSNFQVPLSDTTLDMGKDGGFTYANGEHTYELDTGKDPLANQGIGWIQPLAAVLAKGDQKLTSDFTDQFYHELTKDGKVTDLASLRARVVELYNHFQLKPSIVAGAVNEMKLDQGTKDAMLAAIDNLRPGKDFQVQPGTVPLGGSKPTTSDIKPGTPRDNMSAMGSGATSGKMRISPGIWKDAQGEYKSVDGVRR